ncbi:hypothetical protein AJ80_07299 [Polytolypa hystricis UAMH7299]|uniref:Uncharacterized protein n=1 Tax=Polytolypa hystricis (strain UAMH7299) TaxID=1447883 RepID=A0A2B7XQI4_POLH7|nr:hypothetical protein AJ80_07299 [Polytolypa hystricis UAMH7299]
MATLREPRQLLPPGQVDCKWWKKGYCFRGTDCYFRHDPAVAGVDKPGAHAAAMSRQPSSTSPSTSTPSPAAADPPPAVAREQCGICLEVPTTYGLLVHCDHVFCLECIRNWRSSSTGSNNNNSNGFDLSEPNEASKMTTKKCPLCRVKSDFIVPSSVFPTPPPTTSEGPAIPSDSASDTGDGPKSKPNPEKETIVNSYLARLRRIPCRYFEDSLKSWREARDANNSSTGSASSNYRSYQSRPRPECRFGNSCHYSHMNPVTDEPYVFSQSELNNMRRSRRHPRGRGPMHFNVVNHLTMLEDVLLEVEAMHMPDGYHISHFLEYTHGYIGDDDDDFPDFMFGGPSEWEDYDSDEDDDGGFSDYMF